MAVQGVFERTSVEDLVHRHMKAGPDRPLFAPEQLLTRPG